MDTGSGLDSAPRARAPRMTLSQRILGVVWEPADLDGVLLTPYEDEDAPAFVSEHYARIFGDPERAGSLLVEAPSPAKRRFLNEMDVFTFSKDGYVIGILMGHPTDWSSYYIRSLAFLENERARGLAGRVFEYLKPPLRAAGVSRMDVDVQPSNVPMLHGLFSRGFVPTGTIATERWGLFSRMTFYLTETAHGAFVSTYAPNRV